MTRTELIRAVGDALTHLDLLRFDTPLNHPDRKRLNAQRRELDALLDRLVDAQIDETTAAYKEAGEALGPLNDELKKVAADLSKLKDVLDKVAMVVDIVGQVAGAVVPLI